MNEYFGKSWQILIFLLLVVVNFSGNLVKSEIDNNNIAPKANNSNNCSADIRQLTPLLLEDLPGYANRVILRTQKINRKQNSKRYIITANKAEYEPLNLPQIKYDQADDSSVKQAFFTVLERQYMNQEISEIQTFHWLFLTQSDSGWRMVTMFSRFGTANENPPTPPQESSNGIIGQAVQLWLKDCRWGTLRH